MSVMRTELMEWFLFQPKANNMEYTDSADQPAPASTLPTSAPFPSGLSTCLSVMPSQVYGPEHLLRLFGKSRSKDCNNSFGQSICSFFCYSYMKVKDVGSHFFKIRTILFGKFVRLRLKGSDEGFIKDF